AAFPSARAADMATTALAQAAYLYGIPFVAVRAISDLCGPTASKDFSVSLDVAATRSAAVVTSIVEGFR
ncbi:MAG: 5'-nucleosidase, partial [Ruaniaceae bacterium]|nr:5'-nucleosidase [Ruaniaceae bacterium]